MDTTINIEGESFQTRETFGAASQPPARLSMISWRSILAGTVVALFFYMLFMAVGVGFVGISLGDGIQSSSAASTTTTGLWVLASSVLALFFGSYIATRVTPFVTSTIARWQGAVIASLFFLVLIVQMASVLGVAGRLFGQIAGFTGSAITQIAESSVAQDILDTAVADLNLRSPTEVVMKGVAVRLLQGDAVAARDYLARQANIAPVAAQARIEVVRGQLETQMLRARDATSRAVSAAGWSLAAMMLFGILSAVGAGYLAARENFLHPSNEERARFLRRAIASV